MLTRLLPVPMAMSIAQQSLRDVLGILWMVAAFASILCVVVAVSCQRDRRAEQAVNARFDEEFSEMYDAMEKNAAYAKAHPDWREVHLDRRRTALQSAQASRWESACRFWMLATVCAIAAIVMVYLSAGRV